ncbi:MAG: hypothetical protein M5R36_02865 [Deltaproteobacteria bacterium]|nr:hypothetical protein [Deltaproteobacteria bacterium]
MVPRSGFREAPTSDLKFWLSLGFSYMVLVTLLAYLSARDIYANRKLLPLLAAGKAASSLSCLVFFIASAPYFIYLLNFLVDGSIVFVALGCYAVIGWLDESRGAGNGGRRFRP